MFFQVIGHLKERRLRLAQWHGQLAEAGIQRRNQFTGRHPRLQAAANGISQSAIAPAVYLNLEIGLEGLASADADPGRWLGDGFPGRATIRLVESIKGTTEWRQAWVNIFTRDVAAVAGIGHEQDCSLGADCLADSGEIVVERIIYQVMLAAIAIPVVCNGGVVWYERLIVPVFWISQCLIAVLVCYLLPMATEMDVYLVAGAGYSSESFQRFDNSGVSCFGFGQANNIGRREATAIQQVENQRLVVL